MALDLRTIWPPGEGSLTLPRTTMSAHATAYQQAQGQVMQQPRQAVANFALPQSWTFAGVAADMASPEPAASGPEQALLLPGQEGTGPAVGQASASDVPVLDTAIDGVRMTGDSASGFPATDMSIDAHLAINTESFTPRNDETSDSEAGDMLAAIRKAKKPPAPRVSGAQAKQDSGLPTEGLTTNSSLNLFGRTLQGFGSFGNPSSDGTKHTSGLQGFSHILGSSFLTKYNYTGNTRLFPSTTTTSAPDGLQKETAGTGTTLKHSRKKPSPELIDLTTTPDDQPSASHRKRKRRKHNKHRSEKRHRSDRVESQALDGSRKGSSRHKHRDHTHGAKEQSDSRSRAFRKSKDSSRQKHNHERHKEREREGRQERRQKLGEQRLQQPLQLTHPSAGLDRLQQLPPVTQPKTQQETRSKPPNNSVLRLLDSINRKHQKSQTGPYQSPQAGSSRGTVLVAAHNHPQRASQSQPRTTQQLGDKETTNAIKYNSVTAGEKARNRVAELKNKEATTAVSQPNGGHLTVANVEGLHDLDADFYQSLTSKIPEKRSAQLVPSLGLKKQLVPNTYRRASERAEHLRPIQFIPSAQPAVQPPFPFTLPERQANLLPPGPINRNRQISNLAQSGNIFRAPVQSRSTAQPRTNIPQHQTILPPPPPLARPALTLPQRQPQQPLPHQQQPRPQYPPRETIPLLEALGPDREVIQYVVYRTRRFLPPAPSTTPGTSTLHNETKEPKDPLHALKLQNAIRSTSHLSLAHANSACAAQLDRICKGAVSKAWAMTRCVLTPSHPVSVAAAASAPTAAATATAGAATTVATTTDSGSGDMLLYEGRVGFQNGEVQFFWVSEEVVDINCTRGMSGVSGGNGDVRKSGGWTAGEDEDGRKWEGVKVDKEGAAVWKKRVRFDVWSRIISYAPWVEDQGRRGGEQRVVVDCEGEEEIKDGGEERGDGEDGGEKVGEAEDSVLRENMDEGNDGKDELVENDPEATNQVLLGGNGDEAGSEVSGNRTTEETPLGEDHRGLMPEEETASNPVPASEAATQSTEIQRGDTCVDTSAKNELAGKNSHSYNSDSDSGSDSGSDSDDGKTDEENAIPALEPTNPLIPSHSAYKNLTVRLPHNKAFIDFFSTTTEHHGTYTSIPQANRGALAIFLELAKPQNSSINDNYHYKWKTKPEFIESFEESGAGNDGCNTLVEIEWDPPEGNQYRWKFLRVVVQVVQSELTGPVDVSDMVVEGGYFAAPGRVRKGGKKGEREVGGGKGVGETSAAVTGALPNLLEEESEPEVSEEE